MKIFIASRRGHYQINRCLNKKLCTCFLPIFTELLAARGQSWPARAVFQSAFLGPVYMEWGTPV